MGFQTPITIKAALDAIQSQQYVLPAIQREFIWGTDQICSLFDSLMQGYPIGAFLFWEVKAERSSDYVWYGFVRDYHERLNPHCPRLDLPGQALTAILDGQQRLTSLNIGLRGRHAEREKGKRRLNLQAYPERRLYVNLLGHAAENDLGMKYDFRFLTTKRAAECDEEHHWFLVADIYDFEEEYDVLGALQKLNLAQHRRASRTLSQLYATVHKDAIIPFFVEHSQDLDKVLNIFIRVNSAGTPLSYSDLLLSIATAQWNERDARQEIHALVDDLNGIGHGFSIPQDIVLKTGLLVSDIPSIGFRVTNFTTENMRRLEDNWDSISDTIRLAVSLMAQFGFSSQNLAAASVLLPLAYYLHHRRLGDEYLNGVAYRADRAVVRGWVCRSLVKQGVWGSALDGLLLALRTAIQGTEGPFPLAEVEAAMARRGKPLTFSDEEVDDLLESPYGRKRTFSLLSLMYPFIDIRNHFHVDHIFPRGVLRANRLSEAGVPHEDWPDLKARVDNLPNLQLLEGAANSSKSDKLPGAWLNEAYPRAAERQNYCSLHDLGEPPGKLAAMASYWDERKRRMERRLRDALGLDERLHPEPDPVGVLRPNRAAEPLPERSAMALTQPEVKPESRAASSGGSVLQTKPNGAGYQARGVVTKAGFKVLAGSTASGQVGSSLTDTHREHRSTLLAAGMVVMSGDYLVFKRDVEFGSPSAAASFVAGSSRNGNKDWVSSDVIELGSLPTYLDERESRNERGSRVAPGLPSSGGKAPHDAGNRGFWALTIAEGTRGRRGWTPSGRGRDETYSIPATCEFDGAIRRLKAIAGRSDERWDLLEADDQQSLYKVRGEAVLCRVKWEEGFAIE